MEIIQTVDGQDFLAWQRNFGGAAALGDTSGDATVDDYDLWLWTKNFSATAFGTGEALGVAVPEPSTALLLLTLAALFGRRYMR